jgi:iron complex outermembrane receptor protein
LLYGQAFRAPVFNELYLQNRPGSDGNPELKPETIRTLELSFNYRPSQSLKTTLSLYTYQAEDLIVAVPSNIIANTFTMENRNRQDGRGIEWEANWYVQNNLQLSGNFSWQFTTIPDTDFVAPFAPAREAYVQISWQPANYWSLHGNLYWLDTAAREVGDPRAAIEPQTRCDVTARYRNHYTPWEYSLIVHNLFDKELIEPSVGNDSISGSNAALPNDVPMPGRAIYFQIKYVFGKL